VRPVAEGVTQCAAALGVWERAEWGVGGETLTAQMLNLYNPNRELDFALAGPREY
jgi:hypothetical protein